MLMLISRARLLLLCYPHLKIVPRLYHHNDLQPAFRIDRIKGADSRMNENILRHVVITQVPQTDSNLAAAMLRLVLYPHELCRLPQNSRGIRVLAGQAWVTLAGEDL